MILVMERNFENSNQQHVQTSKERNDDSKSFELPVIQTELQDSISESRITPQSLQLQSPNNTSIVRKQSLYNEIETNLSPLLHRNTIPLTSNIRHCKVLSDTGATGEQTIAYSEEIESIGRNSCSSKQDFDTTVKSFNHRYSLIISRPLSVYLENHQIPMTVILAQNNEFKHSSVIITASTANCAASINGEQANSLQIRGIQ